MNLVVGSTSQLSRYFPDDNHVKVSSRDIDISSLTSRTWDAVYICFAEQRTYLANSTEQEIKDLFWKTNVGKTLAAIEALHKVSNKIVYYSTAELWNNTNGPVNVTDSFCYHSNSYTESKREITDVLKDKKKYPKVSILYPFNFNSIHRGDQYLFGKIFGSILSKRPIIIGDVSYYREMLHPSMIVDASMKCKEGVDEIVGSGRVVFVKDFIKLLYGKLNLIYEDFVTEQVTSPSIYRRNIFYAQRQTDTYSVDVMLDRTTKELIQYGVQDASHS
jgi:nucleoside-diphosphate-sugar epimerase